MDEIRSLLTKVFEGSVPVEAAADRLRAYAKLDLFSNPAFVKFAKPLSVHIPLDVATVAAQLRRFKEGGITSRELQGWAALVVLSGAFDTPDAPLADENWYDELWDVVNDLACPAVFGPITVAAIDDKLGRLAKYQGSAV